MAGSAVAATELAVRVAVCQGLFLCLSLTFSLSLSLFLCLSVPLSLCYSTVTCEGRAPVARAVAQR